MPPRPTATKTAGPTTAPRRPSPRRWSWSPPTKAPGRKRGVFVIAARRAAGHPGAMKLVPKDGSLRRVVLVAYPDVQILDVTGPLEVFANANRRLDAQEDRRSPRYTIEIVAAEAGPLRTMSGLQIVAERAFRDVRGPIDTLLVAGGEGTRAAVRDRTVIDFIRRAALRARRVASICSGTFLLAEAGLLDGKRATTHWAHGAELAQRYPKVRVEIDPIFVRDGKVWSSAGVCAGMDLALALAGGDHGRELALTVAQW